MASDDKPCPNCGRCPTCGRTPGWSTVIYPGTARPWPYPWPWTTTPQITWGNSTPQMINTTAGNYS